MNDGTRLAERVRERMRPTFIALRDECVAGLELATDVEDVEQASFWAHKLISALGTMGYPDIASACQALEMRVDDGAGWRDIEDDVILLIGSCRAIE